MTLATPSSPPLPSTRTRVLREWSRLATLGAPIMVAQLAQMANGVIDTVMAGHASAEDLAGVSIGASLWIPILLLFGGILNALQPTISGHLGAKQTHHIMPTCWQGMYIALAAAILMALILVNVEPLLVFLKMDDETARIADGYLYGFAWGIPALVLMLALRGLTDGLGHTKVIMVFSLLSAAVNLPLNYIFIYGYDLGIVTVPAMGGIGCGWATSLANWIAVLALLVYLNVSRTYKAYHLVRDWTPPQWNLIGRLLKLGFPIGITSFVEVSMFSMVALFLAPLGAVIVAGHQIVLNLVSVVFMVPLSLGIALTLRISYLIGAQQADDAKLLARSALVLAIILGCNTAALLLLTRHWLPTLYTSDDAVRDVASHLLLFGAIFQLADVLQVTMMGVQRGYKDTKIPMIITLFSFWGICLPLGYILTFKEWITAPMGAQGFWIALIVGLVCAATLLITRMWRFRLPAA